MNCKSPRYVVSRSFALLLISLLALLTACGGGGGGDDDNDVDTGAEQSKIFGQAFLPPTIAPANTPAANAAFQVVDFQKNSAGDQVATGTTGADGSFDVTVNQSKIVAIIVNGQVRVSGLVAASDDNQKHLLEVPKNFNGITDVACEAGVTAIGDGAVSADDFTLTRITNLENGANVVVGQGNVDFNDPASVSAAARQVRVITANGDVPPAVPTVLE